jgi:hypothetical protein
MAAQTKNHSEESLTRWGKISLANSLKKNMYFSNQRPKAKDKARKERVYSCQPVTCCTKQELVIGQGVSAPECIYTFYYFKYILNIK